MTKIEWTDESWNPIRRRVDGQFAGHGCVKVSPGCKNCYAERIQPRFGHAVRYAAQDMADADIYLDETELLKPLRWKKPRMIFVCSMSDLFWERIPDEWIDRIFAVMALANQHTFQVLTKRATRMREYLTKPVDNQRFVQSSVRVAELILENLHVWPVRSKVDASKPFGVRTFETDPAWLRFPLPNVWLGVSVEDQTRADERIPALLDTPAAIRFVSAEPLLGPVDFLKVPIGRIYEKDEVCPGCEGQRSIINPLIGDTEYCQNNTGGECSVAIDHPKIDWVIVGGESGPNARPMHPDWARSLRDQCAAADVPFFFKQWGAWLPWEQFNDAGVQDDPEQTRFQTREYNCGKVGGVGAWVDVGRPLWCSDVIDDDCVAKVGKAAAGNHLDGGQHLNWPPLDGQGGA